MTKPTGKDLPAAVRAEIVKMVLAISRKQLSQEQAMQHIARMCLTRHGEIGLALIPQHALDWLMGIGDTFEPPEGTKKILGMVPRFWWRSEFHRRIAAGNTTTSESK